MSAAAARLAVAVVLAAGCGAGDVDTSFGADDQFIGTPLTSTAALTHGSGASVSITATE